MKEPSCSDLFCTIGHQHARRIAGRIALEGITPEEVVLDVRDTIAAIGAYARANGACEHDVEIMVTEIERHIVLEGRRLIDSLSLDCGTA